MSDVAEYISRIDLARDLCELMKEGRQVMTMGRAYGRSVTSKFYIECDKKKMRTIYGDINETYQIHISHVILTFVNMITETILVFRQKEG